MTVQAPKTVYVGDNFTVRFTVGDFTTKEDIDYAVDALAKVVNTLRQVSPVTGKEGW